MALAGTDKGYIGGVDLAKVHTAAKQRMASKDALIKKLTAAEGPVGNSVSAPSAPTGRPQNMPATGGQLVNWLKQAGFQGEELRKAWAVAMRESNGRPGAFNGNAATGDKSYGLFQINMLGSMGASRMKQFGLSSEKDLLDPLVNAKAAYQMSRGGWSPWDIDTSGYNYTHNRASWQKHYNAYMKYYNQFPSETQNLAMRTAAAKKISK
jgi:hypothetical protein